VGWLISNRCQTPGCNFGTPLLELAASDDISHETEVSLELTEVTEGPGTLVLGSSEPASDSKTRALEVAVTDAVATVFTSIPLVQPVVHGIGKVVTDCLLTSGDFRIVVEWPVPAHLPAPPRLSTPPMLSSYQAFYVPVMLRVCSMWPLPPWDRCHQSWPVCHWPLCHLLYQSVGHKTQLP